MTQQAIVRASEGHRNFGKLLRRVYGSDEHLVIERDGFPMAVMMSYQEYQRYQRYLKLKKHRQMVRQVAAEAEKQGLTEDQLFRELKETRQEIFREKYDRLQK